MRRLMTAALFGAVLFAAAGCSGVMKDEKAGGNPVEDRNPKDGQGITANQIDYTTVQYEGLPEKVQKVVDEQKRNAAQRVIPGEDDTQYVFISLGERPTGGYGVIIKQVEDVEGRIVVVFEEKKPAPGAVVTQAITYPWTVIRIDPSHGLPVDIRKE